MKQCPNCQGLELYDDEEIRCPHCDSVLVPYVRSRRTSSSGNPTQEETVRPTTPHSSARRAQQPEFEQRVGRKLQYRGIVDSITPSSRFMPRFLKWANAVFRGQPFQLGNPVHETTIRIEEISQSRLPDRMRSLVYYGELNELDVGDDVTISAYRKNSRLIIKRIRINDIESDVKPHGQISAAAMRIVSVIALSCIVFIIAAITSFFTSGGIWKLFDSLVTGTLGIASRLLIILGPIGALVLIYWLFFRKR